jgi:hypothetical protein
MKSVNPETAPPWTRSTDHEPILRLFLKENNSDYSKNQWNHVFKKHLKLFQNYILVLVILHLGP